MERRWWVSLCVCMYANDVCVWCMCEWVYVRVCVCAMYVWSGIDQHHDLRRRRTKTPILSTAAQIVTSAYMHQRHQQENTHSQQCSKQKASVVQQSPSLWPTEGIDHEMKRAAVKMQLQTRNMNMCVCVPQQCNIKWVSEWVSAWVIKRVSEWWNEWEWVSECERVWAQCPTPATQKPPAMHIVPLAVHIVPRLPRKSAHCGTPATQKRRRPRDARPLGSAHCPTAATQKRRRPRDARRTPRAYIRPLGSAHCPTPATQKRRRPRDASRTPGRTSDPLAVHIVPRLPRKRGGDPGTPAEPQGVHPTPWQCTFTHACHAKEAETQGRQPNPRAYIRPLGSAHGPTPATQKRRRPTDASRTPGRTSDPLAVHMRWVSKGEWMMWVSDVSEWVSERASEWASERVSVCQWVSEWASEWVSDWVSEWVTEWGEVRWVRRRRTGEEEEEADTELKAKTPHVNVGN